MHIYAFGSICRGELDIDSDIDLLAISDSKTGFDPNTFSIYSYNRIRELWEEGNPFAWHLAFESRLIFSSDKSDFLEELGIPNEYKKVNEDCAKFDLLFHTTLRSLTESPENYVFELSNIYLAIRNYATCFGLGCLGVKQFSRYSPLRIQEYSLSISPVSFSILQRARFLCTRGRGAMIDSEQFTLVAKEFPLIQSWIEKLNTKMLAYGRV
jgi:predicted nucleotidyltransferase